MKKTLLTLTLLASTGASAQEIPKAFIGTWGTGDSCENPATIEEKYISTEEHMAPMFVDRIAPINDEKIRVFASKTNQGTVSKDNWTLTKANGYLIIEDQQGRQRFLKSCVPMTPIEETPNSRWRVLSDRNDTTLLLDSESITHGSLWVKLEYKTTELFAGQPLGYVLIHNEYDCKRRTGGAVQTIIHDRNRAVLKDVNEPLNRYNAILPESMDETFMNLSCKE